MESVLLDVAGHRRSPATMPGYHRGRPPRNKGEQYPADPPTVEEIVAVMRAIGDRSNGRRLRSLIVLLWRAGLRISEALAVSCGPYGRSAVGSICSPRSNVRLRRSWASRGLRVLPSRKISGGHATADRAELLWDLVRQRRAHRRRRRPGRGVRDHGTVERYLR
jgi:integrase